MPLINADRVIGHIMGYRLVHVQGRLEAGKTSLALRLALELLDRGYRLGSNFKCIFNEPLESHTLGDDGMLHSVFIPDEGGMYFKSRDEIEELTAYAAKMDYVLLISSFHPPHRSARVMRIQPLFSFYSIGLPLVQYSWRVKIDDAEESGKFYWLFPEEVYGLYSRQDTGGSAKTILKHLTQVNKQFEQQHGRATNDRATYLSLGSGTSGYLPGFAETPAQNQGEFPVSHLAEIRRETERLSDLFDEMEETELTVKTLSMGASKLLKKARRHRG